MRGSRPSHVFDPSDPVIKNDLHMMIYQYLREEQLFSTADCILTELNLKISETSVKRYKSFLDCKMNETDRTVPPGAHLQYLPAHYSYQFSGPKSAPSKIRYVGVNGMMLIKCWESSFLDKTSVVSSII